MKSYVVALVAVVAAVSPWLTGCAEDDVERQAAYPQPIGYTSPPAEPPSDTPQAAPPAPPSSPPPPPPASVAPLAEDTNAGDVVEPSDGELPAAAPAPGEDYADNDPSALSDFRSTLDPYGSWVDDPTYGTVWVPSQAVVGDDFTPYQTAGHWVYDDDYTWVSDYEWGWAPFHYGRWAYAAPYGWGWIPGRVYSGAWVSWRYGSGDWGYVGWAPLAPTWGWRGGAAFGLGFVPAEPYGFCAAGDLFAPRIAPRLVAAGQVGTIGAHTRAYVPAAPSVNGRVRATPGVNGPPPQIIGIRSSAVAHGALANRGVVQARAFSHAGTAATLGARAPQGLSAQTSASLRVPAYGASVSSQASHFGGKLGYGIRGSATNLRPSYGGYGGYGGYAGYGRPPSYPNVRGGFSGYSGPVVRGSSGAHTSSGHSSGTTYGEGGYLGGHHGGVTSRGGSFGGGLHAGGGVVGGGGSHGGFSGGGGGGHGGGGHR